MTSSSHSASAPSEEELQYDLIPDHDPDHNSDSDLDHPEEPISPTEEWILDSELTIPLLEDSLPSVPSQSPQLSPSSFTSSSFILSTPSSTSSTTLSLPSLPSPTSSPTPSSDSSASISSFHPSEPQYPCPVCHQNFNSEYLLIDHHLITHENGFYITISGPNTSDTIPTYSYGEHECHQCQQRYLTSIQLNEHFALSHMNYEELCEMDYQKPFDGFPGFDLLELIRMIEPPSPSHRQRLLSHGQCLICYGPFQDHHQEKLTQLPEEIGAYYSDSESYPRKVPVIPRPFHPKIFQLHRRIALFDTTPIILCCCQVPVCRRCLQTMIQRSNNLICAFCRKDHEQTHLDYITLIQPVECPQPKWRLWWRQHLDIMAETQLSPEEQEELLQP